jgi:hypothetical protein
MFTAYFLLIIKTNRHWILWNTNVHHCVHKWPPLAPVMRQINPIHMIHVNSIVQSMPSFLNEFFPLRFPPKFCILVFSVLCHTACSSHILGLDQPNNIWRQVQIMTILAMPISPVSSYFVPRRPKYRPEHSSPEHHQPVFFSKRYESNSHSYIQTGKSIVVYILTLIFVDSKREDGRYWSKPQQALSAFSLLWISSCAQFLLVSFSNVWIF